MTTPKKKKHNWMTGFVLPKRCEAADLIRAETTMRLRDHRNRLIQAGVKP